MFDFKVTGLSEAEVEIQRGWPTSIISAISLNHPLPRQGEHHLIIDVEDVHVESGDHYATTEMIEQVLDHTAGLMDQDRVLVHCFAGQSRSSAIMLAILIQHGMNAQAAFDAVKLNRPMMIPNQLIVRLVDDRFVLRGALVAINNAHVSAALRSPQRATGVTKSQSAAMKKIMDLLD